MDGLLGYSPEVLTALGVNPEDLRRQQQQAGLLSAGLQLLAGSGYSPVRQTTGQLLGQAGLAGVQGMQQAGESTIDRALKGLQVQQFVAQQNREKAFREAVSKAYTSQPTGIGAGAQQQAALMGQMQFPGEEGAPAEDVARTREALLSNRNLPQERVLDDKKFMAALAEYNPLEYAKLTLKEPKESFRLLSPAETKKAGLPEDASYQISSSGKISRIDQGPLVKNIVGGQSGLDNEMKIRGAFKDEPVYKAYNEMRSAYNQISDSLKQASPAGDLAGATKFMKLLDPGSVVRESELFMAMQASGALDRFTNYATNVLKGTKLTPTQRLDFQALADKLYAASVQSYNKKRDEYASLAQDYGLNPNRATGPAATFSKNIKVDY